MLAACQLKQFCSVAARRHPLCSVNGEANLLDWKTTSPSSGYGSYGTCCIEMDIWEANKMATAVTPHPCEVNEQTRCSGVECGNGPGQRYKGTCDPDGGDWNPFRLGDKTFFGPGSGFTVDTTQVMTVVTQFFTDDGTANGNLQRIHRKYVQNGKTITENNVTIAGGSYGSITDAMVNATKKEFNNVNSFAEKVMINTPRTRLLPPLPAAVLTHTGFCFVCCCFCLDRAALPKSAAPWAVVSCW